MAQPNSLTDEIIRDVLRAIDRTDGAVLPAAKAMGTARQTLYTRLNSLRKRGFVNADNTLTRKGRKFIGDIGEIEFPSFPDDDISAEEILEQHEKRFNQRLAHFEALKWFEIKINHSQPIGLCVVGDPHLGANGCNVTLLKRDVDIMANTEGMYAINIGDTADNWGGRLMRLYAENDVSRATERRLAKWFLQDAGIRWLVWLEGNHENMDSAMTAYLRGINAHKIPMVDWRAQFKLIFKNGREVRVDAAHDFKGHSMWNDLHSLDRASKEGAPAHIYMAGHRHLWAHKKLEAEDGTVVTLVRSRGYKYIDDFSHRHQYGHKQVGATVCLLIDPNSETEDGMVTPYSDLAEAQKVLTWKRQ